MDLQTLVQRRYRHPRTRVSLVGGISLSMPMVPVDASRCYLREDYLLTAAALKEQAMSRKPYSLSKQLVVATALALGASGAALADDNSMDPFSGDSYKYFNGYNLGEPGQFKRPVFSNAPADPSWRQSHPNGHTDLELAALGSSSLSRWQLPNGSANTASASSDQTKVAQNSSKETFSARLAKLLHPANGIQARTYQ